ncbi:vesicular glutamate transporter 1 isoform X1 [Spodoptera litura]|uniref:Vesicular glutamate transporter 1 isoform X1 n=1 Tax=Spodoptera litura TaxID=69820 RepID=A0A9J7DR53_SPOLT|nr:vesicular glutamate transporter 1 isoform X1 [Spodoptera litura]XP_022814835.1 vesicular glutamate transporter 1 isoform X1 [Spodoptera litura]
MQGLHAAKEKASGLFANKPLLFKNTQYENFQVDQKGYDQMYDGEDLETPPSPDRPPPRPIDKYVRAECPCLSARYTVALLACFGFSIMFGMRCNMSMAKLKMTEKQSQNSSDKAPFEWTVSVESSIDSSYFAGYLITQVPGGFLASMYPANKIFGAAIVTSAIFNMAIPGAMSVGPAAVVILKIAQGFVEGVTYPSCHGIWRMWAPPLERSRLATLAFCGTYAGIVIGMPLSGLLTDYISWQAPFYFYGVSGVIWYVLWLWLVFERPSKHPTIASKELTYIEQSLGTATQAAMPGFWSTPWKAFATSPPVYAIIVANFCRTWNFCLLVIFQSSYFNTRFNMQITESGFVGAIPHLIMTSLVPIGGMMADYLRKNNIMSTTTVRKLFNCGGFGLEAFFFVLVAYANNKYVATIELTLGVACSGFAISGYNVNHLDIAPRYASILMGLSNGIGTIAGFVVPIVIDYMTQEKNQLEKAITEWRAVFLMGATVHFVGITIYAIFASGELQPWAETAVDEPQAMKSLDHETTFTEKPSAPLKGSDQAGYGAIAPPRPPAPGAHVPNNPFVSGALYQAEPIQPPAHDYYDGPTAQEQHYVE